MNRQTLSRLYLIAALAVLLALTLPLLALAPCAVPAGDDYSYGTETHRAWRETGSVPAAVAAAHGCCNGSIRRLNKVLTGALRIGAQQRAASVDAEMVLSASQEASLR